MTVLAVIRRRVVETTMKDIRCPQCSKLLFRMEKTVALRNFINVQCSRCKENVKY